MLSDQSECGIAQYWPTNQQIMRQSTQLQEEYTAMHVSDGPQVHSALSMWLFSTNYVGRNPKRMKTFGIWPCLFASVLKAVDERDCPHSSDESICGKRIGKIWLRCSLTKSRDEENISEEAQLYSKGHSLP